jgi:flagellar basal-body rod protein FlgB
LASLFDTTAFRITEQGINVMARQNAIIAQNIVNADTPGYKTKYLYFEGVLQEKIEEQKAKNPKYKKQLNIATALYTDTITTGQADGNNVDNDTQQALFNKNSIHYAMLQNKFNSDINIYRTSMRKT